MGESPCVEVSNVRGLVPFPIYLLPEMGKKNKNNFLGEILHDVSRP